MPASGDFKTLRAYLRARLARENLSENQFSEHMGWRRNYINSIMHGLFLPSPKRCDKIAAYFGDDPIMVRVLAGHQIPNDSFLDQLRALTHNYTDSQRRALLRTARDLSTGNGT